MRPLSAVVGVVRPFDGGNQLVGSQMTCQDVIAAMMDYLSQTQDPVARQAVDEHLASCAHCARFMVSYRATPGIVRRATAGLDWSGAGANPDE